MLNQSTDMNFGNLGNQEKGWKLSACCYVNIIFFCKKMSKMLIYTKKWIYVTNLHFCVKKCAQSYISAFCSLFCLWTLFCLCSLYHKIENIYTTPTVECKILKLKIQPATQWSFPEPKNRNHLTDSSLTDT